MSGDKLKLEYTDEELEEMSQAVYQKVSIKILIGLTKALYSNGKEGALDKIDKMYRIYKVLLWVVVFLISSCWAWIPQVNKAIKVIYG